MVFFGDENMSEAMAFPFCILVFFFFACITDT